MAETAAKLDGAARFKRLCAELPPRIVKKGLRQALNAAGTPILRAARAGAAHESGTLRRAMAKKTKSYKSGTAAVIIGANRKVTAIYKGAKRVPFHYIHLVEKGTKSHAQASNRGQMWQHPGARARPFLAPAYAANKTQAVDIAGRKLAEVIEAEAKKLGQT